MLSEGLSIKVLDLMGCPDLQVRCGECRGSNSSSSLSRSLIVSKLLSLPVLKTGSVVELPWLLSSDCSPMSVHSCYDFCSVCIVDCL